MEIAHILEELAYDPGGLPREAIEAAVAKKQQIIPALLKVLEDAIERVDEIIEDDNYQGHLYAMYLLAQFREPRAFPYIIRLFSFPSEIPHAIAGDMLTEDLSRIFASVSGSNVAPLHHLIENPAVNEYVRAAAQTALVILVGCGTLQRSAVIDYFKTLFETKLHRSPSFAWGNLISCCCTLHPLELLPQIQKAFDDKLIDASFIKRADVEKILSEDRQACLFNLCQNAELIDDTVSEMEKWIVQHA
jgi:hypothetical protein